MANSHRSAETVGMKATNFQLVQMLRWSACLWAVCQLATVAAEPTAVQVVTAALDGSRQAVAGRLVVEARDGSLLVETATQQLKVLAGSEIISRTPLPPAAPLSPR